MGLKIESGAPGIAGVTPRSDYQPGDSVDQRSGVYHNGKYWFALRATSAVPSDTSPDWRALFDLRPNFEAFEGATAARAAAEAAADSASQAAESADDSRDSAAADRAAVAGMVNDVAASAAAAETSAGDAFASAATAGGHAAAAETAQTAAAADRVATSADRYAAAASASAAGGSATASQQAADRADASASAAASASNLYVSVTEGEAATTDGDVFSVVATAAENAIDIRKRNVSGSTLLKTLVGVEAYLLLAVRVTALELISGKARFAVADVASTANDIVVNPTPTLGALVEGAEIFFEPRLANDGAMRLNVSGFGLVEFRGQGDTAMKAGEVQPSRVYGARYSAHNERWRMISGRTGFYEALAPNLAMTRRLTLAEESSANLIIGSTSGPAISPDDLRLNNAIVVYRPTVTNTDAVYARFNGDLVDRPVRDMDNNALWPGAFVPNTDYCLMAEGQRYRVLGIGGNIPRKSDVEALRSRLIEVEAGLATLQAEIDDMAPEKLYPYEVMSTVGTEAKRAIYSDAGLRRMTIQNKSTDPSGPMIGLLDGGREPGSLADCKYIFPPLGGETLVYADGGFLLGDVYVISNRAGAAFSIAFGSTSLADPNVTAGYEAALTAHLARYAATLSTAARAAITTAFRALWYGGVLQAIDAAGGGLYTPRAPNLTDSRINWAGAHHTLVPIGAPSHNAWSNWTFDDVDDGFETGISILGSGGITPTNHTAWAVAPAGAKASGDTIIGSQRLRLAVNLLSSTKFRVTDFGDNARGSGLQYSDESYPTTPATGGHHFISRNAADKTIATYLKTDIEIPSVVGNADPAGTTVKIGCASTTGNAAANFFPGAVGGAGVAPFLSKAQRDLIVDVDAAFAAAIAAGV